MELDIDKLQKSIKACAHHPDHDCESCEYCGDNFWCFNDEMLSDFDKCIELLKEQEAKERKWLQTIADNQIANAPKDSPMSLDEQLESEYKSGIYDGLQMAFEILMEGR